MNTGDFVEFIRFVAARNEAEVCRRLRAVPELATMASRCAATRQDTAQWFLSEVSRYLYAGDTALHIAAAACSRPLAALFVFHGANCRARNRPGAEPLHYASDGNRMEPQVQADVIDYLTSVGADPNAVDRSGVSPLHRAVRTRSSAAVRALLDRGALPRQPNKSGSTPLHLAVQPTGRGGSGSLEARREQAAIIALLLERGAKPTDRDFRVPAVGRHAAARAPHLGTDRPGHRQSLAATR